MQPDIGPGSEVSLREITEETVREICRLAVTREQEEFVAPNSVSLAEALFSPTAWFRAIYADDTPVGFVMLDEDLEDGEIYVWRMMIAAGYQRMGFGGRAIEEVIRHARSRNGVECVLTSVVQADGGPQEFYEKFGFRLTGEIEDDEAVMRLML